MVNLDKARKHLESIVDKFKSAGGLYLFYDYNNQKFRPIVMADSEDELKEKMNKKLKKHPDKYTDSKLVSVFIQNNVKNLGTTDYAPGVGGALGISVMVYHITSRNTVANHVSDGSQRFWFTDEQLEKRKFSLDDIKNAIDAVVNKKLYMHIFQIYDMSALDKLYKKKKKSSK